MRGFDRRQQPIAGLPLVLGLAIGAAACAVGTTELPPGLTGSFPATTSATGGASMGSDGSGSATSTSGADATSDAETGSGPADTGSSSGMTSASSTSASGSSSGGGGPFCGDGTVDAGEECDDANADNTDACLDTCVAATCGDGFVQAGVEECDDANAVNTDACLDTCVAASCGDGFVQENVEACDDGTNDGSYGGCAPGCASLGPHCGDNVLQAANEHCDVGLADPYPGVGCDQSCLYDFSGVTQLYCNGTCTWAGAQGCDQADADIYCRLVTGNAASTAQSFNVVTALAQPGFSCPSYGTNLGPLPEFGVNVNVWYQGSSIQANHGSGSVVANIVCN